MSQINTVRVVKNSIILYVRVLVSMLISLWTTRVILQSLGVSDYGIYNVVAGFVVMFGIISSSMSAAISRYLTFELGHGDTQKLKDIFSTSICILFIISALVFVLTETVGLWFVNYKMYIPAQSIFAANFVYQFSILSFIIDLVSVPYNAAIIAHERMKVFAYVGILTSLAKFGTAYAIMLFESDIRLIAYAAFMMLIAICVRLFYGLYCTKRFYETAGVIKLNRSLIKEISSFAGWNFIGSTAGILKEQGANIILNIFFGPVVNASRGIAVQVSGAATTFANNFMTALNPQITKSYAANEREASIKLGYMGSRLGFFLMLIIALPILFETQTIIGLWLGEVPEYCTIFVQLTLINSLIDILSGTLITIMLATGRIRNYQIVVGMCNILVLPIAYILLKLGFPPQSTMIISILMSCVALVCRLVMLKMIASTFSIQQFLSNVVMRVINVVIVSVAITCCLNMLLHDMSVIAHLLTVCVGCILITISTIVALGLTRNERVFVFDKIKKVITYRK